MSATLQPPPMSEIRDYLLRRMADADRARFEAAYFADDALLDRIEAAEDQLVSEYVLGRLTESDRRRFESSLLGMPYYKERVETTTRLRRRISRHELFQQGTRARALRKSAPEEDGLFPGRTGSLVLIALLTTLLAASIVSAMRLKKELEIASRKPATPARAAAAPPLAAGAVVMSAQTLVLDADAEAGPSFRRVTRAAGAPLVLALGRRLVPAGAKQVRVTIADEAGRVSWDSGPQPARAADSGDLALRLPPGVPPQGLSAIRITPLPPFAGSEVLAGVVFIEDAPAPTER